MAEENEPIEDQPPSLSATAVGFTLPNKSDVVRRALAEGIQDPGKIAAWAKGRSGLNLNLEEIEELKKSLGGASCAGGDAG